MTLTLLLTNCSDQRDIRDYYFPVKKLINTEGKVYTYENTGTLPGPDSIYWYYLGVDLDTALYLSVTRYGPDFSPQQLSREEITNSAVKMREMTIFQQDTAGRALPTKTEIIYDRTFPFYLSPTPEAYGYRIRYGDEIEQTFVTLDRTYRSDTTVSILGEQLDALVFNLAGEVSVRSRIEGDISPTFTGYEVYARGVGLVEYYRDLGAAGTVGGKLSQRTLMSAFSERMKQRR